MNQFLKNHQLNKAEICVTDESISDWISGSQDTFSSIHLYLAGSSLRFNFQKVEHQAEDKRTSETERLNLKIETF